MTTQTTKAQLVRDIRLIEVAVRQYVPDEGSMAPRGYYRRVQNAVARIEEHFSGKR
jgi:hypothetical protein